MQPAEWPVPNLARAIASQLWGTALPAMDPAADEREFQREIGKRVGEWLSATFPSRFTVKVEPGGGGVAPVGAFGTSFWPDISVESSRADRLVAIEVKCLRGTNLPTQLSQALGQALVYQQLYAQSLIALIPLVAVEIPAPPFFENVAQHGIEVAILGPIVATGGPRT